MRPFILAGVFLLIFYAGITQDDLTARVDRSGQESDLRTPSYHHGILNLASIAPAKVSISQGFTDPDFGFEILFNPNEKNGTIQIQSLFDRTLQYTLSNMEGKILVKRIFVKEDILDTNKLEPGLYPMYFFRGKRIVKALLLEKS